MRDVRPVTAEIFVTTAMQDSTTTTVLTAGSDALLIDPAWSPSELDGLADWLAGHRFTVRGGFATHAHHDHVLWHPRFGSVPRWASRTTARRAEQFRDELVAALGPDWPPELAALVGHLRPTDEPVLDWPEPVELIRHDAHTPGHTALWLPVARVLVAGDMLSDIEPPLPEETGVPEYLSGLNVLWPFVRRAALVIPGHGAPGTDAIARWHRDRMTLLNREPAD